MSDHTNPTTIRLDDDDKQLLEDLAKKAKLPRAEVVRQALRLMGREFGLTTHPERHSASA